MSSSTSSLVKPLAHLRRSDLPLAGGKGANLGALIAAGLPVPDGFCITTQAYRDFVAANRLQPAILRILDAAHLDDPAALEAACAQIQALFFAGRLPPEIAAAVQAAYAGLDASGHPSVAVRSSATAEDLPDLSFAGQQDTYLNIQGQAALLQAVVRCWASLWTARAIGYRARNAIPQGDVALAVVVQRMVPSQASGVLFTANPLTGKRGETVIDATLGLGEALVSGQVEPDHYVLDAAAGRILSKRLGAKAISIRGQAGGGVQTVAEDAAARQALPDEHILALGRLGRQAEETFQGPQDMEWAWDGQRLYVVQSRPITSLFPLPEGMPAVPPEAPLEVLFYFGIWQGMLDPYTPVGQDVFTHLVAGLARRFGDRVTWQTQRLMLVAGERLFVNITGLFSRSGLRQGLRVFIESMDAASAEIVGRLMDDPRLAPGDQPLALSTRLRTARALAPVIGNAIFNLLWPAAGRWRLERKIQTALDLTRRHCAQAAAAGGLPALAAACEQIACEMPAILLPHLLPGVISGQAPLQILLRWLAPQAPGGPDLALELTRGLPYNVTTEMDLALWRTAQAIRRDPLSRQSFTDEPAGDLSAAYLAGQLPPAAQAALSAFLHVYGLRGVGEVDLGRPRWQEDPLHIVQVLKSYLQIDDTQASPEALFQRGASQSESALERLAAALQSGAPVKGWLKARLARLLGRRVRQLGGLRETPKFVIVRILGLVRLAMLQAGQQLAAQGLLEQPTDVLYLHLDELKNLPTRPWPEWREVVAARRQVYQRELGRKRAPRLLLSDGSAFYEASPSPANLNSAGEAAGQPAGQLAPVITGSPVSPGVSEGRVRVVLDPHGVQLAPGEILVCPATDPAWTPLFLAAGGLVMEVGGMMTHGSVVAREYGIPAVVGVSQATTRLQTGMRVRVDGSNGLVAVLGDSLG